ncbi:hypothetical protein QUF88_00190 [Bacillus sp. DX1.1]|uniref:hypothetical protein n=1 Tax=unclassified Bacillus (in: firmicutes) TaxID=185979 RepID=UPI002570CD82|nr:MULTISPECIES: hypothetical protein [unclassified Bacillus (in: firmicutes)]MDM5152502.1 hypothetical protein [Bacillus sp. DX1.1]WJE84436.1 hypothetical protein QRE67_27190 [Bacillus sp. DX3.1]
MERIEPLDLYELKMSAGQNLTFYNTKVKRGVNTYNFEIYKASDIISVYFVDENGRTLSIASTEEMLAMLLHDEDKVKYRNIVGDAEWLLLDGISSQRGMSKEEQAAFLYLKENVLEEMATELEV